MDVDGGATMRTSSLLEFGTDSSLAGSSSLVKSMASNIPAIEASSVSLDRSPIFRWADLRVSVFIFFAALLLVSIERVAVDLFEEDILAGRLGECGK